MFEFSNNPAIEESSILVSDSPIASIYEGISSISQFEEMQ